MWCRKDRWWGGVSGIREMGGCGVRSDEEVETCLSLVVWAIGEKSC